MRPKHAAVETLGSLWRWQCFLAVQPSKISSFRQTTTHSRITHFYNTQGAVDYGTRVNDPAQTGEILLRLGLSANVRVQGLGLRG